MNPTKQRTRRTFLAGSVVLLGHSFLTARQAPTSAGPADPRLIEDLGAGYRILASHVVRSAFCHGRVRQNLAANHFVMSRSLAPELVTAGDLIEFDLDGNAVDAKGRS